ncbi:MULTISPECIES: M48 family metalloprotease [Leptolyngbya]|uniref:M48 family metalloprotease n=1 Tax=Leptolyngbya TaxID=47251 RepID=UPI001689FE7A|nr:M48 family metalloprotease [Leptolyngbya sp. FACHB-1624]MBD1855212.1 M48 family metalloprotease [Leptolyngbya sp. FACHB-1624]
MKKQVFRQRWRWYFPRFVTVCCAILLLIRPIAFAISASATTPSPTPTVEKPTDSKPDEKPTESKPAEPKPDEKPAESKPAEPTKTPEQLGREKTLIEADRLYRSGDKAQAVKLYQAVKPPFQGVVEANTQEVITDPAQLSTAGQVYWRESEAGLAQNLESRIFVPLELLVKEVPQFVPGQLRYAEALEKFGKTEQALAVLEKAATRYPNQPELIKAKVAALAKNEKWIDASIAARQFALLNPNHSEASALTALADDYQKRYQKQLRSRLRGNLVGGILTGALGYALTGSLFGPLTSVQNTALLLRGESAVGDRVVRQAKRQLDLVEDKEVNDYVAGIGQKLADAAGRKEFKYEFYVVLDDKLNAFALPGGKVFVNAGAIEKANSEAELAGLLGHELSHAILSHSFQLITEGSLTANITQFIPYVGGLITDLTTLSYSRDMERQADVLGTRLLASTDYAADGLYNLMVTLRKQEEEKKRDLPPAWLASHPLPNDRVNYLQELITQTGYNRYAFEGVEQHSAIQSKVKQLVKEHKEREEKKGNRRDRN